MGCGSCCWCHSAAKDGDEAVGAPDRYSYDGSYDCSGSENVLNDGEYAPNFEFASAFGMLTGAEVEVKSSTTHDEKSSPPSFNGGKACPSKELGGDEKSSVEEVDAGDADTAGDGGGYEVSHSEYCDLGGEDPSPSKSNRSGCEVENMVGSEL